MKCIYIIKIKHQDFIMACALSFLSNHFQSKQDLWNILRHIIVFLFVVRYFLYVYTCLVLYAYFNMWRYNICINIFFSSRWKPLQYNVIHNNKASPWMFDGPSTLPVLLSSYPVHFTSQQLLNNKVTITKKGTN